MQQEKVAKRYAKAFMQSIRDDGALPQVEVDLATLLAKFQAPHSGLAQLIENPSFNMAERKRALRSVMAHLNCHPVTQRFLMLLIDKGRARLFPAVVKSFIVELDQRLLRTRARITTAWKLGNEELMPIMAALSNRLAKAVVAEPEIDPNVIGGVKAQIGGLVFDGTLQTQLQTLHRRLYGTQS